MIRLYGIIFEIGKVVIKNYSGMRIRFPFTRKWCWCYDNNPLKSLTFNIFRTCSFFSLSLHSHKIISTSFNNIKIYFNDDNNSQQCYSIILIEIQKFLNYIILKKRNKLSIKNFLLHFMSFTNRFLDFWSF